MSESVSRDAVVPLLSLGGMLQALGNPRRWQILQLLADGQPKMVTELADELGKPVPTVSQHVQVLFRAGMLLRGQAGMYRIPPQFLPEPGKPVADFGYFVLRLDVQEPD